MIPLDLRPEGPAGRLLRAAWQPVARSLDLAPSGLLPLRCLGDDWLLWRTEGGAAVLSAARCPHRGTRLSLGRVRGAALECHHHGLCYDARTGGAGQGPPLPLRPVEERGGLVFGWFGADPPAPFPDIPELDGPLRCLPPERWPCTFFARLQNSLDVAHIAAAHRRSGLAALLAQGWTARVEPEPGGFQLHIEAGAPELRPVRFQMPNRLEFDAPLSPALGWRRHLVWRVPEDADHCVSFTLATLPAPEPPMAALRHPFAPTRVAEQGEALLDGRLRWEELRTDHLTEVEDYVALCGGPPGLWPAQDEPGLAALLALWGAAFAEPAAGIGPADG